MGVTDLWSILESVGKPVTLSDLQGKTVAIDLSIWIRESVVVHGIDKPYLRNIFWRVSHLLRNQITPVFVVDGEAPALKAAELNRRLHGTPKKKGDTGSPHKGASPRGKNTQFIEQINQSCQLLDALGVCYVQSDGEAEATCAQLNLHGVVDACVTQDGDAFLFGARTVYRNFTCSPRKQKTEQAQMAVYRMHDVETALHLTRRHLVSLAVLLGCDYYPGVKAVGPKHAIAFMTDTSGHDPIEALKKLKTDALYERIASCESTPKGRHCQRCQHPGNKSVHQKLGCALCQADNGCEQNPEDHECQCPFHSGRRLLDKHASEMKIHRCIKDPHFPPEKVIEEFLNPSVSKQSFVLEWQRPSIHKIKVFNQNHLHWGPDKVEARFVPLFTAWDLSHPEETSLLPLRILKIFKEHGQRLILVEWKYEDKSLQIGRNEAVTTQEHYDVMRDVHPDLVSGFEEENKKTKVNLTKSATKRKLLKAAMTCNKIDTMFMKKKSKTETMLKEEGHVSPDVIAKTNGKGSPNCKGVRKDSPLAKVLVQKPSPFLKAETKSYSANSKCISPVPRVVAKDTSPAGKTPVKGSSPATKAVAKNTSPVIKPIMKNTPASSRGIRKSTRVSLFNQFEGMSPKVLKECKALPNLLRSTPSMSDAEGKAAIGKGNTLNLRFSIPKLSASGTSQAQTVTDVDEPMVSDLKVAIPNSEVFDDSPASPEGVDRGLGIMLSPVKILLEDRHDHLNSVADGSGTEVNGDALHNYFQYSEATLKKKSDKQRSWACNKGYMLRKKSLDNDSDLNLVDSDDSDASLKIDIPDASEEEDLHSGSKPVVGAKSKQQIEEAIKPAFDEVENENASEEIENQTSDLPATVSSTTIMESKSGSPESGNARLVLVLKKENPDVVTESKHLEGTAKTRCLVTNAKTKPIVNAIECNHPLDVAQNGESQTKLSEKQEGRRLRSRTIAPDSYRECMDNEDSEDNTPPKRSSADNKDTSQGGIRQCALLEKKVSVKPCVVMIQPIGDAYKNGAFTQRLQNSPGVEVNKEASMCGEKDDAKAGGVGPHGIGKCKLPRQRFRLVNASNGMTATTPESQTVISDDNDGNHDDDDDDSKVLTATARGDSASPLSQTEQRQSCAKVKKRQSRKRSLSKAKSKSHKKKTKLCQLNINDMFCVKEQSNGTSLKMVLVRKSDL